MATTISTPPPFTPHRTTSFLKPTSLSLSFSHSHLHSHSHWHLHSLSRTPKTTKPLSVSVSCKSTPTPTPTPTSTPTTFHGKCYVVSDNIDTDQIIPAEYLTLVPSNPTEYAKLGSYALIGLPDTYDPRFVTPPNTTSEYSIVIAGANFGCGSSREHAPVALGAAGVKAVVAESYARIFFRNSVSTGEIYPIESQGRVCDHFNTGDFATLDLQGRKLVNHTTGKVFFLKDIGDAGPVVDAGGIFAYARKAGMIAAAAVGDEA